MLKITGGIAKGRSIKLPPGDVRPAMARARISLFDYLADFVDGARIIDLYCGSGSLGFEALSRNASLVDFVDNSGKVIKVTKINALKLGFEKRCKYTKADVFQFLDNFNVNYHLQYDIVFAAPPYKIAEPDEIIQRLHQSKILRSGGRLCMEYPKYGIAPTTENFTLERRKYYGTTVLEVWEYSPAFE